MSNKFISVMMDAGLSPPDYIEPGRIHRFPGQDKHNGNKAGWCMLFDDSNAGIFGDWSTGLEGNWHEQRTLTLQEKAAHVRKRAQARKKLAQERKENQSKAAISASELWNNAIPEMGEHKYLRDKAIQPHGIRSDGFNLLIPMYDPDRKLCSIQTINPNGDKLFHKGGCVKGCYYPIGKPDGVLCLAEGFATAATIHEATGHAVAVCFNAGNLEAVALALHKKYPAVKITIYADNDIHTKGNPGLTKGREAAASVGGNLLYPVFDDVEGEGTDFNDYVRAGGML